MTSAPSSILLQNLSASCRFLRRAYAEGGKKLFPQAPTSLKAGDEALHFFADELGVGIRPLEKWRSHQLSAATVNGGDAATRTSTLFQQVLTNCPSPHDATLQRTSVERLGFVLSPFVRLSAASSVEGPSSKWIADQSSQFVAAQNIPAGMLLMSIPTECALVSSAPQSEAGDLLLDNHMHIDDLAAQLWSYSEDPSAPHYHYANYLLNTVTPPKNLPFLKKMDLTCPDVIPMWEMFHQQMEKSPLSEFLHSRLSPEEYLWFVSVVMSRRSGLSTLIPVFDKLNHDVVPNSYFSMSSESTFCGLDIVDNIVAGVDSTFLFTPYIHLFAINPIPRGHPLTISYSDLNPKSPEGSDVWRICWGFVPDQVCDYTEGELREVAGVVVGRRIEELSTHFPLPAPTATNLESKL
jgi:hypothetical protein